MISFACICGGIVEYGMIAAIVSIVSAWLTKRYNRKKCQKYRCLHKCSKPENQPTKVRGASGADNNDSKDGTNRFDFGW